MKIIVELEVSYEVEMPDDSTTEDWLNRAHDIQRAVDEAVYAVIPEEPVVIVSDVYEWED